MDQSTAVTPVKFVSAVQEIIKILKIQELDISNLSRNLNEATKISSRGGLNNEGILSRRRKRSFAAQSDFGLKLSEKLFQLNPSLRKPQLEEAPGIESMNQEITNLHSKIDRLAELVESSLKNKTFKRKENSAKNCSDYDFFNSKESQNQFSSFQGCLTQPESQPFIKSRLRVEGRLRSGARNKENEYSMFCRPKKHSNFFFEKFKTEPKSSRRRSFAETKGSFRRRKESMDSLSRISEPKTNDFLEKMPMKKIKEIREIWDELKLLKESLSSHQAYSSEKVDEICMKMAENDKILNLMFSKVCEAPAHQKLQEELKKKASLVEVQSALDEMHSKLQYCVEHQNEANLLKYERLSDKLIKRITMLELKDSIENDPWSIAGKSPRPDKRDQNTEKQIFLGKKIV